MSVRRMIKIFSGLPLFGKYIFSSITPKCPKEVSVTQFFFFLRKFVHCSYLLKEKHST